MNTIARRYMLQSQAVARRVEEVLNKRGLKPAFSDWVLTQDAGMTLLFGVLDVRQIERLERYSDDRLLHQLTTVCNGLPCYLSNTNGLRYGFLLSQRPRLPRNVDFPGCKRGLVRLGVGPAGQPITTTWNHLGHLLVAGKTGAGKSSFLRLLAYQGLREGMMLLLSDLDGTSFPMLAGNPALLSSIAGTPEEAHEVVAHGLAECNRRAALYRGVAGYPEDLDEYNALVKGGGDPLPRVLIILDEFNATVTALGGHRGQFARDVAQLGWRGRKFGINLVFAAQDFAKSVVGRVRDQVAAAICFRVRSAETARNVGCTGAHRIPESLPGRAVTDRWGPIQAYRLDKSLLGGGIVPSPLSEVEVALVQWTVKENECYLSLNDIRTRMGLGPSAARKLAREWERRGWLEKDPQASNKRRVTSELAALVDKPANPTNPTNPTN